MYPPFRCHHCPCFVRGCFVCDGSAPPAVVVVVADNWRLGKPLDGNDNNNPTGRVSSSGGGGGDNGHNSSPNALPCRDHTMTSLSCSSSLLVVVIIVVVVNVIVILPKCPSQSWRSETFKKSRTYSLASVSALSSSSAATPLSLSPSQSSCPMNPNNIDHGH